MSTGVEQCINLLLVKWNHLYKGFSFVNDWLVYLIRLLRLSVVAPFFAVLLLDFVMSFNCITQQSNVVNKFTQGTVYLQTLIRWQY